MSEKRQLATLWLNGCSGCHMSFLDMDERILEILDRFDLVYSPLVDVKEFPEDVDVALVEGSIGSEDDREKILVVRQRTKILASLGDCAVTGNIPSMRNLFSTEEVMERTYLENSTLQQQVPSEVVPRLLARDIPIHEVVTVDLFIPGCPPHADTIHTALTELAEGRIPDLTALTRFGA